jgi:hypothetical protein
MIVSPQTVAATPQHISTVTDLFKNQLIGGGLVLMFTGSIIALLRNLPSTIIGKIRRYNKNS